MSGGTAVTVKSSADSSMSSSTKVTVKDFSVSPGAKTRNSVLGSKSLPRLVSVMLASEVALPGEVNTSTLTRFSAAADNATVKVIEPWPSPASASLMERMRSLSRMFTVAASGLPGK